MTVTKNHLYAQEILTRVTRTGKAEEFKYPGLGDRLRYDAYHFLKASLSRKLKTVWRAGRAGFAYTSWPKPGPEEAGVWIFPDHAQAVEKREEMRREGWTVRLTSWEGDCD